MSDKEINNKPQSRFIEHFNMMSSTEIIDKNMAEKKDKQSQESKFNTVEKRVKKTTPLFALNSNTTLNKSTASIIKPMIADTATIATTTTSINHESPKVSTVSSNDTIKMTASKSILPTIQQHQQQEDYPILTTAKKLNSLNRADIIIKRYESWNRFILLIITWINEITKLSAQSEKSYQSLMDSARFSNLKSSSIETVNSIHATMHGFTMDLALQEKKFGRNIQAKELPILETFKNECQSNIKSLKNRQDLGLEEFLKQSELTVKLITQLGKTCKEARRTIEKGSQVTNDPWLANLYLLRQLKKEVDEENRLRKLMIPIQQTMQEFETRLLKAVESTLKVCFNKPGVLDPDQMYSLQSSLNQAITNNWDTFVTMNKKDIVNEDTPLKHYLNINYPCKNDALVMTAHKGQLERRFGVLNVYAAKFFVITESGFLHQFRLNDKNSPEQSLYLVKSTIAQLKDGHNTFEVQRSGSVLQRDKSFVFRTFSSDDMIVWCNFFYNAANKLPTTRSSRSSRSSQSSLPPQPSLPPQSSLSPQSSLPSHSSLPQQPSLKQSLLAKQPPLPSQTLLPPVLPIHHSDTENNHASSQQGISMETTPPLSPFTVHENQSSTSVFDDLLQMKPKLFYTPQLNFD